MWRGLRAIADRLRGRTGAGGDGELARARELYERGTSEEFGDDPRSLNLLIEAADILLARGARAELMQVLQYLLGTRYQFGYYSYPQYLRVNALRARVLDAHADAASLRALAAEVRGGYLGGDVSSLLEMIAERLVDLGDEDAAMALMQRLTDYAGENPEGWDWVHSVDPRHRIETRIRARHGLPPLPKPERPMPPAREPDPGPSKYDISRGFEEQLRPLLGALELEHAVADLPAEQRVERESAIDAFVAKHTADELRVIAEVACYGYSRGGFTGGARLALRLHERGLHEEARYIQRWLASDANWSDNPNNARRKNEALDTLDPILGKVPRHFPGIRWGDADTELHTIEERAYAWSEQGYASRFDAARRRLARGDWAKAYDHIVRGLTLTWRKPSERPPIADEVTRAVLLARQPLERWEADLLARVRREWHDDHNDPIGSLRHPYAFVLLGWIGLEHARRGDRRAAELLRDALASVAVEDWDDIELDFMEATRADAIARIASGSTTDNRSLGVDHPAE